jgi:hypothetical protein
MRFKKREREREKLPQDEGGAEGRVDPGALPPNLKPPMAFSHSRAWPWIGAAGPAPLVYT